MNAPLPRLVVTKSDLARIRIKDPAMTDRVLRFSFNAPGPMLNANARSHWAVTSDLTKTWRRATYWYARQAMGTKPVRFAHAHVQILIGFTDNRRRDISNWAPTAKAVVDGIVDAGVLVDDDDAHMTGPELRRGPKSDTQPYLIVTITETPGGTP